MRCPRQYHGNYMKQYLRTPSNTVTKTLAVNIDYLGSGCGTGLTVVALFVDIQFRYINQI